MCDYNRTCPRQFQHADNPRHTQRIELHMIGGGGCVDNIYVVRRASSFTVTMVKISVDPKQCQDQCQDLFALLAAEEALHV